MSRRIHQIAYGFREWPAIVKLSAFGGAERQNGALVIQRDEHSLAILPSDGAVLEAPISERNDDLARVPDPISRPDVEVGISGDVDHPIGFDFSFMGPDQPDQWRSWSSLDFQPRYDPVIGLGFLRESSLVFVNRRKSFGDRIGRGVHRDCLDLDGMGDGKVPWPLGIECTRGQIVGVEPEEHVRARDEGYVATVCESEHELSVRPSALHLREGRSDSDSFLSDCIRGFCVGSIQSSVTFKLELDPDALARRYRVNLVRTAFSAGLSPNLHGHMQALQA